MLKRLTWAGSIVLAFCALPAIVPAAESGGATFLVTTVEDDGPGSLRRAIEEANVATNAGEVPDTIAFAIPGAGPHVIALYSALPAITDPVTIDGFMQPGSRPNALDLGSDAVRMIEIEGPPAGQADGLVVRSGSTRIRGLVLRGFSGDAIRIEDRGGNTIEGNRIGGAAGSGIAIVRSSRNVVGGTAPESRNEIAEGGGAGVLVSGEGSTGNSILGNRIRSNDGKGIELDGSGPNRNLGAPSLTAANRITGEAETGRALRVEGSLRNEPDTTLRVELFATRSDIDEKREKHQGDKLVLATSVTTGRNGEATFLLVVPDGVESRALLTATATDPEGNTSELSDALLAPAVLKTWSNGAGGGWNTAGNWTPSGVPAVGDDVDIKLAGTYTVTVDTSPTVGVLTVGGTSGTQTLSIAANTLTINGASTVGATGILSQAGGTITGTGALTINGVYNWSIGTMTGTGVTTINGSLNLSSVFVKDMPGGRILNTAAGSTTTWTGTAAFRVGTGSVVNNSGTWDCQSDTNIQNPFGGTAVFNNSGTFKKTVGAGVSSTLVPFHNTGTVTAQTGTISLQADGTHTGSFNSSGGTVQFNGGIHNLNAGTSFTGTVVLVLGTINVNTALTVPSFTQNGGTLQGAATFTVSGLYSWSTGVITGAGTINANGGMALSGVFVKDLTGTKILNTPAGSTVTWTGTAAVRVGTGSVINNAGTWDCQSDTNIQNPFGGTAVFNNSGTFKKTVGAGVSTTLIPFHNTGAVTAQTGTISLQADGTHAGSFNSSGGTVQFNGGIHNLNAGTSFTGTVVLVLGTVNVNSALTIPSFTQNGGTLQGAATFTVSGLYSWSTGVITGAGTINANGGMALSGVFVKDLTGTKILNTPAGSTVTWTGTAAVRVGTGSVINNAGTWDCQSDTNIQNPFGGTAVFNNSGTFKKTVGTGVSSTLIPFHNTGAVTAQTGTISLQADGTHTGSFNSSGGTVQFNGGIHNLNAGTSFTGTVVLVLGTVNVNSALTIPSFTQNGGTLQGAGTLTVTGLYSWSTGVITGAGTINANGGMALSGVFTKDMTTNRILNTPAGSTVTWTGTGTLRFGTGSVINNAGTWDCQSDTNMQNPFTGTAVFNNSGTFKKTVGTGVSSTLVPFHNTGAVTAQTGTISLQSDGTHTGSFNSAGGTVQFNGGIHNLNAGTSFTGTVVLVLGTINVNSALTIPSFTQNGGTLQGAGTLTVTGLYSWSTGVITGAGTINANGGMALSGVFTKDMTTNRILNTPAGATVTWTGTGTLRFGTGSVINNAGTWDCQSDTNMQNPFTGTAVFNNSGTFKKTVGAGASSTLVPFHNTGAVTAQTGTISLQSDGTHTGSFNSSGGTVQFNGGIHNLNAGTSFTGTVVLVLGTVNVNGAMTVPSFTQTGGTLQGPATFTVSGLYSWSTGIITGAGTINANGGMALSGVFAKDLTGGKILNTGAASTTTSTGTGAVRVGTGSVINNAGTWDCQSDTNFQNPFGGTAAFNNSGTFKKSVGTGSSSVIIPFTNTGSVLALTGNIAYSAGFVQTAGSTTLNGGNVSSTTAMDVQGGILQGIGTVSAAITNGGQVAPGLSPAILSETGNYTQTSAGSLSIEIGGLTAGAQHDRLAVTGTATLAGTLAATLINGFVPASGDSFTVLTYTSKTGTFATLNLPALPAGWYWITSYGSTSLTLTAILDTDNDGVPNAGDCAPFDGGAFAAPTEIAGDVFAADKQTYSWISAVPTTGPATVHNVVRGALRQFPVGTGGSETCLASGIGGSSAVDLATPAAGSGVYYLVRAKNVCGTGTYGFATGGAERITAICP